MSHAAARYSRTAMGLHWIIALLIMFAFGLGERTEHLPKGAALFAVFQLHKSIGITILLLSLWRLGLRLTGSHPAPLEQTGITAWLAKAVHWLFYAIMIVVPISGWLIVSTSKIKVPTLLYGIAPWPHLPVSGEAVHEIAEEVHKILAGNGVPLLLFLHVAGAIRHQWLLKEPLVERMVPLRKAGLGTIALLFATIAGAFVLGRFVPVAETFAGTAPVAAPAAAPPAPEPAANATAPVETPEKTIEEDAGDEVEGDEKPLESTAWIVNSGGNLGFTVTVSGQKVSGRFSRWDAKIDLDPDAPETGRIRASIDLASVSSGDAERDSMMASSDFFATSAHPRATYASSGIRKLGGNRYEARGTLTLKGLSRPLRLPFTLDVKGDTATARGSAAFDRRSFKVGEGQFEGTEEVGGDIAVSLNFTARRKG